LLNVPYRSQEDPDARRFRNDCGPACVAMYIDFQAQQAGQPLPNIPIDTLASETTLATNDDGLTTTALIPLAARHGVTLKLVELGLDYIQSEIDAGRPCLALISYKPLLGRENISDTSGHFVVIVGIDDQFVYVNDPDWWNQGTNTREDGHNWQISNAQFLDAMRLSPVPWQGLVYNRAVVAAAIINTIIDLNGARAMVEDMATVKSAGVTAIIHKATQGLTFVDGGYAIRRTDAAAQGLLWGAYHYADGSDGIAQANHFLNTAKPDNKTLIALDLETNPDGSSMTLVQAEMFVKQVHDRTGRWPVLYTGFYVLQGLGWNGNSALVNCALWLAAYGDNPRVPAGWANWTLHQYTDGSLGPEPRRFAGLQNSYDRSQFNGTLEELTKWWGS